MDESNNIPLAAGNGAAKSALLELELPERLIVRVNGRAYELLTPADLPLAAYRTIQRFGPRIAVLSNPGRETTTKAEAEELTQLLDRVCRLVLVAPDDVHARLGDLNRVLIAGAFFTQLPAVGSRVEFRLDTTDARGPRALDVDVIADPALPVVRACRACRADFAIDPTQQAWFAAKTLDLPTRCPNCRLARRAQRDASAPEYRR
jgi:hypothetical protein